jgi:FkbM family methyltransferase
VSQAQENSSATVMRAYNCGVSRAPRSLRMVGNRIAVELRKASQLAALAASFQSAVYIFGVSLTAPIWRRLHTRMRPLFRVKLSVGERTFTVHLSDPSEITVITEVMIDKVYDLASLPRPEVLFDLGANIGVTTLVALCMWPECQIVAVEPDPKTFEKLARNVSEYANVLLVRAAVGSAEGTGKFARGAFSWTSSLEAWGETEVPIVTVNKLLGMKPLSSRTVLKLDIEGGEWEILGDLNSFAQDQCPTIVGELHLGDGGRSLARFRDKMTRYRCTVLQNTGALVFFRLDPERVAHESRERHYGM